MRWGDWDCSQLLVECNPQFDSNFLHVFLSLISSKKTFCEFWMSKLELHQSSPTISNKIIYWFDPFLNISIFLLWFFYFFRLNINIIGEDRTMKFVIFDLNSTFSVTFFIGYYIIGVISFDFIRIFYVLIIILSRILIVEFFKAPGEFFWHFWIIHSKEHELFHTEFEITLFISSRLRPWINISKNSHFPIIN